MPGPGSYAAQSSIGKTVNSNHAIKPRRLSGSAPSTRDDAQRVFISAAAAKVRFGMESPGPAAYANSAARHWHPAQSSLDARAEPGYTVGAENNLVVPPWSARSALPGAGQYPAADSVGVQTLSYRETEPEFGLRHQPRGTTPNKVFLGKEQAKVFYGMESPGPAAIGPTAFGGTGRMVQSTKSTAPVATFGNAGRAGGGMSQRRDRGATIEEKRRTERGAGL